MAKVKSVRDIGSDKENCATEDPTGRHVQESSRTVVKNNHKTGDNTLYCTH
jgi:hypothetical protein